MLSGFDCQFEFRNSRKGNLKLECLGYLDNQHPLLGGSELNSDVFQNRREPGNMHPNDLQDENLADETRMGWRGALPWIGAVAIIIALFWRVPLSEVWEAARGAAMAWFLPEILAAVLLWFALDSYAYSYLISRFNAPLKWSEARAMRGLTYILTAINYNVGTAAIVLYLKRIKNMPALETSSSVIFYVTFDGVVLIGFAFIGAFFFRESPEIEKIQIAVALLLTLNILALLVLCSSRPHWSWLTRIRSWSIFRTHQMVRFRDMGALLLIRIFYFLGFLAVFYGGAAAFGIYLPPGLLLASVPIILVAGALPITPAGLGTQAAAMLYFWADHAEPARIIAFGLVFPISLTLARVAIGAFYISDLKKLRAGD